MVSNHEIREKERRIREFLLTRGEDALLLKRQGNFSWMTGGGLNLVGITTEIRATSILITKSAKFLISNNIEAPRMVREEKLEEQGFTVLVFSWYEEREVAVVKELCGAGGWGLMCLFRMRKCLLKI
jgi:Xaa-Pro dipeptidase